MARIPLYRKAETEMLRRIKTGEWAIGQRLGNEFQLAEEFGVSQGTMRRALITLEGQGFLARKPGRGTIVAEPGDTGDEGTARPGFDRLATPGGEPPDLAVFRSRTTGRRAGAAEAEMLGEARALVVERMLKRGSRRFAQDEISLPESLLDDMDGEAAVTLPDLLSAHGLEVAQIEDRITAEISSMSEAVALEVDRNTALLVLRRIAKDASGRVLAIQVMKMASDDIGYSIGLIG